MKEIKEETIPKIEKEDTQEKIKKEEAILPEVEETKQEEPIQTENEETKIEPATSTTQDSTTLQEEVSSVLEQKEEEQAPEENKSKSGLHKFTIAILVISVLLFIGVAIFSTVFALMNKTSDKIVNGIYVDNIDISGLTKEDAIQKVYQAFQEKCKQDITLKHGDFEASIAPEDIEFKFGVNETIDLAYGVRTKWQAFKR